MKIKLSH